jgi:hypothetical protein
MIWEQLTGLRFHLHGERAREALPPLPEGVATAVLAALAPSPGDRPTARALANSLRHAANALDRDAAMKEVRA